MPGEYCGGTFRAGDAAGLGFESLSGLTFVCGDRDARRLTLRSDHNLLATVPQRYGRLAAGSVPAGRGLFWPAVSCLPTEGRAQTVYSVKSWCALETENKGCATTQ